MRAHGHHESVFAQKELLRRLARAQLYRIELCSRVLNFSCSTGSDDSGWLTSSPRLDGARRSYRTVGPRRRRYLHDRDAAPLYLA